MAGTINALVGISVQPEEILTALAHGAVSNAIFTEENITFLIDFALSLVGADQMAFLTCITLFQSTRHAVLAIVDFADDVNAKSSR